MYYRIRSLNFGLVFWRLTRKLNLYCEHRLYGMGLLQVWLYFHWYPRDNWGVKATVCFTHAPEFEAKVHLADVQPTYRSSSLRASQFPSLS
jgi:hypothetical protein